VIIVNKSIADKTKKPLLGCYSHRFNLAVKDYLLEYEKILEHVNQLMIKLRTIKNRCKLRKLQCPYEPIRRNTTRWSSTFEMVHCFINIRSYIEQIPDVLDNFPTVQQIKRIEFLLTHLKNFESVSKSLQDDILDMAEAQALFDAIVEKYPSMDKYLKQTSDIVHSPNFESGIVKILNKEIRGLTVVEERSVMCFLRSKEKEPEKDEKKLSFAKEVLENKRRRLCDNSDKYVCLKYVPFTSDHVERLFSRCNYVLTSERQSLLPINFERTMYLKMNRGYWDSSTILAIK